MLLVAGGTKLVARAILNGLAPTPGGKRLLTEEKFSSGVPSEFELHQTPFNHSAALARAFDGVREMFLIPRIDHDLITKQRALIVAGKQAGLEEITLLSLIGADSR